MRAVSDQKSGANFTQTLTKFQNLTTRNPKDVKASTEVTQSAIAGIYIPGSLREMAIRGFSRSPEQDCRSPSLVNREKIYKRCSNIRSNDFTLQAFLVSIARL